MSKEYKKGKSVKMCEINQQSKFIDIDFVESVLTSRTSIVEWAYVLHDKDVDSDNVLKEPHYHIFMKFKDSTQLKYVAKWFDIKENYVGFITGRWQSAMAYLTHANAPDKFQYASDEVKANFDWLKASQPVFKVIDDILDRIDSGEIKEYNLYDNVDIHVYSSNKSKIDNALAYWRNRFQAESSRDISVTFIQGFTGSGKTTYAKSYCEDRNKTYCVSSSGNDAMQDYRGEDVLILDDLRDSVFSFTDILKLLDNHTKSSTKSRYNNKLFYGQEIIITSHEPLLNWYGGIDSDARIQLYRRIKTMMEIKNSVIYAYTYNMTEFEYVLYGTKEFKMNFDESKRQSDMLSTLGFEVATVDVEGFEVVTDGAFVEITQNEIF